MVYLVVGSVDYEGGTVHGVFSSKEKAEQKVNQVKSDYGYETFSIHEVVIDSGFSLHVPCDSEVEIEIED